MFKTNKRKLVGTVLAIAVAGALFLPAGVFAATQSFKAFLTDAIIAQGVLDDNAPRQIKVLTPDKPIVSVEVIHKKPAAMSAGTVALTNIDVTTNGSDVVKVEVEVDGATTEMKQLPVSGDVKTFHVGLVSKTREDNFDITIVVSDSADSVLETKVFKVPEKNDESMFVIPKTYSYVTAGRDDITLYSLLKDKGLFENLLEEYKLDELEIDPES